MISPSERFALFLPSLRGGGAERVMVSLARGFVDRGLEVDLVLVRAEGPYLREVPSEVRVVDLGAERVLYSLPGLVSYLRRERPAAMLSTPNHANVVALLGHRIAGVPLRMIIREASSMGMRSSNASTLREKFMHVLMRFFYPWTDGVIAVSHGVAEDLMKIMRIPAEKVKVIYNPAVTPELFSSAEEPLDHPWFAPGEPPVILGVGRLDKEKDFTTLIRAFALVHKERRVRLMILGEGKTRHELEFLVRELGLEQCVELSGFVENPYKYMKRSSVFVLSSRWEGLPNVLIQALALGTPVVSTDCPSGPAEILEGGKWGKLVPVGDLEALAQAIFRTLEAPPLVEVNRNLENYTLDCAVSHYAKVMGVDK